ncbi:hypothetical protein [Bradyrhizobium cenepequi]
MNHSIYSADRATHLKIVVVALLTAATVAGLGLSLYFRAKTSPAERTAVLTAGKPVAVSSSIVTFAR